jgi:MFS transporter, YNFM family, putative membrane transport protein
MLSSQPGPDARNFRRASLALFIAGFATFSLIYGVQPLLPLFAADFAVTPAMSSWALSGTTACLAGAILFGGALSEARGRRGLMFASLCIASLINFATALPTRWDVFLLLRALEGVALGGVPAVAMAYLAEETPREHLGAAMGLYVGGTALGGMTGRVAVGAITQAVSWRVAMKGVAIVDLGLALAFLLLLPPSRNFQRRPGLGMRYHLHAWGSHLRNPQLLKLFFIGSLSMGAFVTVYNYAGFRLVQAPYLLNQRQVGLIFLAYLFGTGAAWLAGALAARVGLRRALLAGALIELLGLAASAFHPLAAIVVGIVVVTIGFFSIQSVASAGVGRLALRDKGHASACYLVAYYVGASALGSWGGWYFRLFAWPGVACYAGALVLLAGWLIATLAGSDEKPTLK